MFISQVIFESEIENKDVIEQIMNTKRTEIESATGIISSEFWWKEATNTVGFSIVSKWSDKESFKNWMKESHGVCQVSCRI
jgi:heme-degrading monooxygenase HmoA